MQKSAAIAPRIPMQIFFHPDCNCRYRICTGSARLRSRTSVEAVTAGGDLHPALKMFDSVLILLYRFEEKTQEENNLYKLECLFYN